ncbi:upf0481 protein [Quercus suber]|uniref:Upf0481 protein n=1 Tax=Quercus suber TaxID=58331 RepID=A0AAW0KP72_QUESU
MGSNTPMELRSIRDEEGMPIIKNRYQRQKVLIAKVPQVMRLKKRSMHYYNPMTISFGPYHHGKPELQAAEKAQKLWHEANAYARSCYVIDSTGQYDDEKFAMMMLQDGCFCLYMIETLVRMREENLRMICGHLGFLTSGFIFPDMFLLENQLPFSLLQVLLSFNYQENEGLRIIKKFLKRGFSGKLWIGDDKEEAGDENEHPVPVHLLDLLQREISRCGFQNDQCSRFSNIWKSNWRRYHQDLTDYLESFHLANKLKESFRSITELKARGIHFKPSKSVSLRDVDFKSHYVYGMLTLPPTYLYYQSQIFYTNLVAFELFSAPYNDSAVTTYISFLNSLIDNAEDVLKELRSKRILIDDLGSDEEVLKMSKEIATYSTKNTEIYQVVRDGIENHYESKMKT